MRSSPFHFLILAVLFVLTSCGARKEITLFNTPYDAVTDTIKQVYVVNDQGMDAVYKIKIGDRLVIRNLQSSEYNAKPTQLTGGDVTSMQYFEVDDSGSIRLPSVDQKVVVAGLTRREVREKMQEIFVKTIKVENPIIDVTVVNLKVTLLGEFATQGNFLLERDNVHLVEVLAEAGGLTEKADPKTLKIIRGDKADPEFIFVNLNDYKSLGSKKLILQNNDLITIMPTKTSAAAAKLQNTNNFVQPVLVLLNLALLIFTITK